MSIGTRNALIAVCVLSAALLLAGAEPNMMAQSRQDREPSVVGPMEDSSVLVELSVVEVNLPALARQGVSPIGGQPHAVTVADILKCIEGGQARIVGGEKIATKPNEGKVEAQTKRTTFVRRETPRPQVDYTPYASGEEFTMGIRPVSETAVSVGFAFESSRFAEKQAGTEVPPETESWNCSGSAILVLGEPQIVGATQNGETAVFLLLVANGRK